MPKRIKQPEYDESVLLVDWANITRFAVDELEEPLAGHIGEFLINIPNGQALAGSAKSRALKMIRLKKQGFRVGASDYILAIPASGYCGLFLELKKPVNMFRSVSEADRAVSADQEAFLDKMSTAGYACAVAYGFDAAKEIITDYLDGSIVEGKMLYEKPKLH